MASYVLAYNTHPGPLVVSADGRMLGGNEWGAVDPAARAVKALGDLLTVIEPLPSAAGTDAEVAAAIAQVQDLNGAAPAPAAEEPAPTAPADASPAPAHRSRKAAQ